MIEHQEGNANFKANLSGKDKGPGKIKGVFYNPSMKFSRDLNVEFAKIEAVTEVQQYMGVGLAFYTKTNKFTFN